VGALTSGGCHVVYVRHRLARLGLLKHWFRLWMAVSALFHYGRRARVMLDRTPAALAARSRVCRAIVDEHRGADVVMLIAGNFDNYWGPVVHPASNSSSTPTT
jgi:hypothetical protein